MIKYIIGIPLLLFVSFSSFAAPPAICGIQGAEIDAEADRQLSFAAGECVALFTVYETCIDQEKVKELNAEKEFEAVKQARTIARNLTLLFSKDTEETKEHVGDVYISFTKTVNNSSCQEFARVTRIAAETCYSIVDHPDIARDAIITLLTGEVILPAHIPPLCD